MFRDSLFLSSDSDSNSDVEIVYPNNNNTKRKRVRTKTRITPEALWDSIWGTMLRDESVNDPSSFAGKKFRLRFRVPFPVFKNVLVPECKRVNIFEEKGASKIPIEFKILLILRFLGRSHDTDTLSEISLIGQATIANIITVGVPNFVYHFYDVYICMPHGEELERSMATYKMMGLNGAFGSMDCTHVFWRKCPEAYKNLCTGNCLIYTYIFI
jgi:hypothetical protein